MIRNLASRGKSSFCLYFQGDTDSNIPIHRYMNTKVENMHKQTQYSVVSNSIYTEVNYNGVG